ncbi:MAG: hypothetical protein J3K34DRAFT_417361 [Monoraphidium minutum]|nr:MAG: hypothetical protein J3K34DRAFT_417361 [Monoraphidium minutum]
MPVMQGGGIPPRVASPAPLPPNAASAAAAAVASGFQFTSSMHTFVHGCSWGSFGNLAAGLGSSGNLAALNAAHCGSGSSTPTLAAAQHAPPPQQQVAAAAAVVAAQQAAAQQAAAGQRQAQTPPLGQARAKQSSCMRNVFSEPSLNTSA